MSQIAWQVPLDGSRAALDDSEEEAELWGAVLAAFVDDREDAVDGVSRTVFSECTTRHVSDAARDRGFPLAVSQCECAPRRQIRVCCYAWLGDGLGLAAVQNSRGPFVPVARIIRKETSVLGR